jgi:NAD+ kinase
MGQLSRIGIVANLEKDPRLEISSAVAAWLEGRGCQVRRGALDPAGGKGDRGVHPAGASFAYSSAELAAWAELIVVLGGDGTLLGTARRTAGRAPLLGINLGHLGFLTEAELPDLYPALEEVLAGRFFIDERLMIEALVIRDGQVRTRHLALNEAVVGKGPFARLIDIQAMVDGLEVANYPSDGLIIATPTGSTAYSLSAGGPVVHPNLGVLLLTPICPHTLYARAVTVSADSEVRVRFSAAEREAMLSLDGQEAVSLAPGDEILVRRAAVTARLVRRVGWSFYDVLRRKLQEAGLRGESG